MTNPRAFSIMSEFERLGGPGISESPELLEKFGRLVRDAEKELFLGCKKFLKLQFMVPLLYIECRYGWGDKSLTMILELLKRHLILMILFQRMPTKRKSILMSLG